MPILSQLKNSLEIKNIYLIQIHREELVFSGALNPLPEFDLDYF